MACSRVNVTFTFDEKFLVGSKVVCLIFTLSQFYHLSRCKYRDRIKRSPDDRKKWLATVCCVTLVGLLSAVVTVLAGHFS